MRSVIVFIISAFFFSGSVTLVGQNAKINRLTGQEKREGWKLLFNGRDFEGWTGLGRDHIPSGAWYIENGTIHKINTRDLQKLPDGTPVESGDLVTRSEYEDFELVFEWKILRAGNTGVKYNLYTQSDNAGKPSYSALGFEYQLLDDADESYRDLLPSQYTGSLYEMLPATDVKLKPAGEFNISRIIVNGKHAEHWLNGIKVLSYEFGSEELEAGYKKSKFRNLQGFIEKRKTGIVIQNHTEEMWFRNIKIREL